MSEPILSILIPSIKRHKEKLTELLNDLNSQAANFSGMVEILINEDENESTGTKRNQLLKEATGKYVVSVDADDEVPPYYIQEILRAAQYDTDCIGVSGLMTTNSLDEIGWELSKDFENDTVVRNGRKFYIRKTNHIAPVKRSIALLAGFPDGVSNGEDKAYSDKLNQFLKTEHKIEASPMYYYRYETGQKEYLK